MLSPSTDKLLQKFQSYFNSKSVEKETGPKIHVDYIASKVASFYEKIRSIVDYQEEHLLRKNAIERMIKRRLIIKQNDQEIAKSLIYELIRAGHFPNDAINEGKIKDIDIIIQKYISVLNNLSPSLKKKEKEELSSWIIRLASCEVEENLAPPLEDEFLADYMYEIMKERIILKDGANFDEKERDIQLFIAVQKALLRADESLITYRLFKLYYPEWPQAPENLIIEVTRNLNSLKNALKKQFIHPLAPKFFNLCNIYNTPFLILRDIILKYPSKIKEINQPELLEPLIEEAYQTRYKRSKAKLSRAAIYSTISIFATKMILAFAIEIPLDTYILHQFSYINLLISILFPPLLMFFIISTIRPPSTDNAQKVIWEVMKIVYESEKKETYEVKIGKKRGWFLSGIIGLTYLITFAISFGVIIWILGKLNFSTTSQIIFLIFICLIGFAGAKIRQRSKELSVEQQKESGLAFLMDFFCLPFIRTGKWLSRGLTKVNLVLLLLTFVWEVPFQVFVEFIENWSSFIKEKKEEIH